MPCFQQISWVCVALLLSFLHLGYRRSVRHTPVTGSESFVSAVADCCWFLTPAKHGQSKLHVMLDGCAFEVRLNDSRVNEMP